MRVLKILQPKFVHDHHLPQILQLTIAKKYCEFVYFFKKKTTTTKNTIAFRFTLWSDRLIIKATTTKHPRTIVGHRAYTHTRARVHENQKTVTREQCDDDVLARLTVIDLDGALPNNGCWSPYF